MYHQSKHDGFTARNKNFFSNSKNPINLSFKDL